MNKENAKKKIFFVNEIRNSWIEIFKRENYEELEPNSLIPKNDHSLLWINSGIAALKELFSKSENNLGRNLVNCQKVVRTDDLSNINENSYHQTLFEMLGCFSIGANFKEEVIPIIWEWFTSPNWLGICPKNLFVTVWKEDKKSLEIWKKQKGLEESKILLGNKETNFWDMGDGPCGPNTEIYYDFISSEKGATDIKQLNDKRYIEICNIVFPEFYHKEQAYLALENKCVDTGAGLERIAMVIQGKSNTFEIDIWNPVIDLMRKFSKNDDFEKNKGKYYIIGNHLRTVIFALGDGANFDPKGRGYILKKLIKKAYLLVHYLGIESFQIINVLEKIIEINSYFYKNLTKNKKEIIEKISQEIKKNEVFIKKSSDKLENYKNGFSGKEIFFLYDTEGIPIEIIKLFLESKNVDFPEEEFNLFMIDQKNKSKEDRKSKKIKTF